MGILPNKTLTRMGLADAVRGYHAKLAAGLPLVESVSASLNIVDHGQSISLQPNTVSWYRILTKINSIKTALGGETKYVR